MGLFDFVRNAGAKIGIGESTKDQAKKEAAAKAAAEAEARAKDQAEAEAAAREAAKKAKAITDAAAKAAAEAAAKEAAAKAAAAKVAADAALAEARKEMDKSDSLEQYVKTMGLNVSNLNISYNDGCAYISGDCPSQADLEKLVLAVGNVGEVNRVVENVSVVTQEDPTQFYTVVSGDTLSKISKHFYGDANKYNTIFEANRPMLSHPDKIFPGQSLRIPALD